MPQIRGTAERIPIPTLAAQIGLSDLPNQNFQRDLTFEMVSCKQSSLHAGLPTLRFKRRYGRVKFPTSGVIQTVEPLEGLKDRWAEFRMLGPTGATEQQFVGIIVHDGKDLFGASSVRTGIQMWEAFSPYHLLERIFITTSFWDESGSVFTAERSPSFNARDPRGLLVGNRSAALLGDSYAFGGTDIWTRRQVLDYVLDRFANTTGYTWTVSGDVSILEAATDTFSMADSETVAGVIKRIINPQFGLDFTVGVTAGGFDLQVFTLTPTDVTFGDATIPRNPRETPVRVGDRPDITKVTFTRNGDNQYSKIRVRGSRILVCFTLDGEQGTLVPKWSPALEAEYVAGAGSGAAAIAGDVRDQHRRMPPWNSVFSVYGAPVPFPLKSINASPVLDEAGQLVDMNGDHQSTLRATEGFTPLRATFDYATGQEIDKSLAGHESDFRAAEAWVWDPELRRCITAESAGFAIITPGNDWGIIVRSHTPHRLAGPSPSEDLKESTEVQPEFDYTFLACTIAVRLDRRLTLEATVEDANDDDGTVHDIFVPGAEYWVAAAGTAVKVAEDGTLDKLSEPLVLRDDGPRLQAVMASAIARYLRERARARVEITGLQPWASTVGTIMSAIDQGGRTEAVGAPVTSVDWTMGRKQGFTLIRAGYER